LTFQALDSNNDGKLSREELTAGYIKLMNPLEAEEEVNRIFLQVDKNNSGEIDYSGNQILYYYPYRVRDGYNR
jgi:calcium-dependent protein kinase